MTLFDVLRERIAASGPLTIAEYMELSLAHPEFGYYKRRDPFGVDGDFITAPEISQIFGELLGIWCVDTWQKMGGGEAIVAELGPGRGTLMQDFLRATKHVPGFHESISVHMVETSPVLSSMQQETLHDAHFAIHWHTDIETLPDKPLLLIANEFFDALPIRQYVRTKKHWAERLVGVKNGSLEIVYGKELPDAPVAYEVEEEAIVESCPLGERILQHIARRIERQGGAALVIDYGYDVEDATGDTLQAVKAHEVHPVFEDPGEADITAYVNFHSLRQATRPYAVDVHGIIPQGLFLSRVGAYPRAQALLQHADAEQTESIKAGVERLLSPQQMGALFKVMAITRPNIHPAGF